jgi:hypothetical protein
MDELKALTNEKLVNEYGLTAMKYLNDEATSEDLRLYKEEILRRLGERDKFHEAITHTVKLLELLKRANNL